MYSNHISIQIIIASLKQYNIRNVVLSPGGSDIPLIHSIETDDFFTCYSVVDERSAVYFGIGVSQVKNEPVVCICTSGTAVSNFLPGITEAFYQNIPIIAITADKNPYYTGQIETQKIEQKNIFGAVSRKSVELPLCNSDDEIWYCERVVKEALLASLFHDKGPVHINVPIVGSYSEYDVHELPIIKPINLVNCENSDMEWNKYIDIFQKSRKILIVVGQNVVFSDFDVVNIDKFFSTYNCVFSVEHISNLKCKGGVYTYPITETGNTNQSMVPDLVISLGNNVASYGMKPFLRENCTSFRHISIDKGGRIRDVFKALTDVFECSPSYFFKYFAENTPSSCSNNLQFYNIWYDSSIKIKIPEFEFSNFYVAQKLAPKIPDFSILHLAILSSARVMQFFDLKKHVRVFCNAGALGIDGCLSTFIGHAAATTDKAFCVIGDLSFFYDMNAAGISHVSNNVRIILLNNGGASEFHFFMDKKDIPTLNVHVCAEHKKKAKGWVESLGYNYYSASNKSEFETVFTSFLEDSDAPKFLEVFTDKEEDARLSKEFYISNHKLPGLLDNVKSVASRVKRKLF